VYKIIVNDREITNLGRVKPILMWGKGAGKKKHVRSVKR